MGTRLSWHPGPPPPLQPQGSLTPHLEGLHGVLDGGDHPLQRRAQHQLLLTQHPGEIPSTQPTLSCSMYLLDQPHLELGEEQLEEEAESSRLSLPAPGSCPSPSQPSSPQPHHLKEPPQQEALPDARGAGKVEFIAQSRSKEEVVQIWNGRAGLSPGPGLLTPALFGDTLPQASPAGSSPR